ncbi:MAG: hypothetical protein HYV61_06310, partial [Candidatus Rokubacteria bacterium]|nr:hypothetical protein [Candidatus Rokubacteria bacterium]
LHEVEPGRLILLRRRGGGGLGLVLAVHRLKGNRVLVDTLLPHGSVMRVKAANVKKVFWATPPLVLPHELRSAAASRHRGWGRDLREALARDGGGVLDRLGRLSVPELLERERSAAPEGALESIECHACPWGATPRCDKAWREIERLAVRLDQRREVLEMLRSAYWKEFLRVVEVLEAFGCVKGGRLTPKGRLVAALRHDHELLVAEVVHRGIFEEAALPEVAALASCLIEEARSGEERPVKGFLKARPKLRRKLHQMELAAEAILAAQRQLRLVRPIGVQAGFMPAVYRWASGDDDWTGIVQEAFGGHEGDLIRAMRRLIDLLRQLVDAPEVPTSLQATCAQAARVLDRGIVLESALI